MREKEENIYAVCNSFSIHLIHGVKTLYCEKKERRKKFIHSFDAWCEDVVLWEESKKEKIHTLCINSNRELLEEKKIRKKYFYELQNLFLLFLLKENERQKKS